MTSASVRASVPAIAGEKPDLAGCGGAFISMLRSRAAVLTSVSTPPPSKSCKFSLSSGTEDLLCSAGDTGWLEGLRLKAIEITTCEQAPVCGVVPTRLSRRSRSLKSLGRIRLILGRRAAPRSDLIRRHGWTHFYAKRGYAGSVSLRVGKTFETRIVAFQKNPPERDRKRRSWIVSPEAKVGYPSADRFRVATVSNSIVMLRDITAPRTETIHAGTPGNLCHLRILQEAHLSR